MKKKEKKDYGYTSLNITKKMKEEVDKIISNSGTGKKKTHEVEIILKLGIQEYLKIEGNNLKGE